MRDIPKPDAATKSGRPLQMVVYGDSLATNLFHGLQTLQRRSGFYRVKRRTRGAPVWCVTTSMIGTGSSKKYLPRDKPDIVVVTFVGTIVRT